MQIYYLTARQQCEKNMQTLRKPKRSVQLGRTRSLDIMSLQELSPRQTKLLLALSRQPTSLALEQTVLKQQLLAEKKLFDPFKYFGCPNFVTYEESYRHHENNFEAMFATQQVLTERKIVKKVLGETIVKMGQASPMTRHKASGLSVERTRRGVARSPKSYVKENKQNYQRLNINNVQKVRVKLKLNKK